MIVAFTEASMMIVVVIAALTVCWGISNYLHWVFNKSTRLGVLSLLAMLWIGFFGASLAANG